MSRDPRATASGAAALRRGAVLIIVSGLAMIILGLALSFLVRTRAESQQTRLVVDEAHARLMMHAALMYLQESSRLGWGEETYGWTDIRDGSLGPRPTRNLAVRTDSTGAPTPTPVSGAPDGGYGPGAAPTSYNIPAPTWWRSTWPRYRGLPEETDASQFPPSAERTWPCPGSVGRFPMAIPVQPPYATQLRVAYNPLRKPDAAPAYPATGWETDWHPAAHSAGTWWSMQWPIQPVNQTFDPAKGSTGMLDPQPQADVWRDPAYTGAPGQVPDFISGAIQPGAVAGDWPHVVDDGAVRTPVQLAVRGGTENSAWFRIYRELQSDHDNDGVPTYDKVALYDAKNPALRNWNVFVIACGIGPSRGYRFWDLADLQQWETANGYPVGTVSRGQDFAADSPLFAGTYDQASFRALIETSRILWFRVEWSAMQGGGWDSANFGYTEGGSYWGFPYQNLEGAYATVGALRANAPKTYGGNFTWLQRLDHQPPNW